MAYSAFAGRHSKYVEDELSNVRAGAKGEKDAAYHIDFALKNGKNWSVIHDLRLEQRPGSPD